MAEVVISEFMDPEGVEILRAEFDTLFAPDLVDRPEDLAAALVDCRGLLVRNRTGVHASLIERAPILEVVGRLGVGLDNIDLRACGRRGIQVLPATGTNDKTVAEFVMGAILVMARGGAYSATPDVLAGRWPRTRLKGRDVAGLTLGLVGFGAIAREVAIRASAFGMRVAAFDPFVPAEDPAWARLGVERHALETLLPASDVVSLHTPLTPGTTGLLDAAALARLPRGAFLVNTARGGIVDEGALVEALRSGHLGGALLDVFPDEPLGAGSIFLDVPNLHLTPHVAGITREAVMRSSLLIAENVRRVLNGLAPTVTDAAVRP